jgi:mRNA interferase HigB
MRGSIRSKYRSGMVEEQSVHTAHGSAKEAEWTGPNDIKTQYHSASIIGNGRVVFNIKGNKYRLIVAIKYNFKIVYIRFIGTHRQYDAVDARTV